MFGGRLSDSSSSSSYNDDLGGPYLCEYCQDKKSTDGMFGILTECPHCGDNSPEAGTSYIRRSDNDDSSLEEGYRLGDFTRGFIRGMTQNQYDPSESEEEDRDWRKEMHSIVVPRESNLRKAIPSRREEVPDVQKKNVVEQASAEDCNRREEPPIVDLQPENSEDNPEEIVEKPKEDEEIICKFCHQRFDASDQAISITICGHTFHNHCMDMHLPVSKQCPICDHNLDWTDVTKECVYCLENFLGWEIVHILTCGHDCHIECLVQQSTPQCPKCEQTYFWTGIQCSICLENMSLAEETEKLQCQHEFHVECLRSWLQNHTTCPLCRMPVNR